jgi:hypothetical protein
MAQYPDILMCKGKYIMTSRVPNLQKIELMGTEELEKYLTELKNTFRDLKQEIDESADIMQVALEENMPGLDRFSSRMKARKVARQLKRAGDAAHRGMIHSVRTWMIYRQQYEPKTKTKAPKKIWKF